MDVKSSAVSGLVAIALVMLCGAAILAMPAAGYRVEGESWPNGVVPYYNAAHDQAWAVGQAVNAWNTSGARVRFTPVSRANARLVIQYAPTRSCERAEATLGYGPRTTVRIWSSGAVSKSCSPASAATAMAHELGHVLGLAHEDRGCAVMNSSGTARGPSRCEPVERWEWRCRLLEHDDVAGAVAIYGGRVRPSRPPACSIYPAIAKPEFEGAALEPSGLLTLRVRRPSSPVIPAAIVARRSEEAYAFAWGRDSCPSRIDLRTSSRYLWPRSVDGIVEIRRRAPLSSGRYCLAVWAIDSIVRPSERPLTVSVEVP